MNRILIALALAGVLGSAQAETVEVSVEGLNCALCSEAMKTSLKTAVGARDIEPRLECGRIYLEVERASQVNEGALMFTLTSNGFNLRSIRPSSMSIAQLRTRKNTC